jgi:hypothetical protein
MTLGGMKCAWLAGVAAGVVVSACSSSLVTRSHSASNPRPARSAASTCVAQSLRVQGGRLGGGAPGVAHGDVRVTNIAASPCVIDAPTSVALLTANRTPLAVKFKHATTSLRPLTISPGEAAWLRLSWTNWCRDNPGPLTIAIGGAAQGGPISGPFNGPPDYDFVPGCVTSKARSTVQLVRLDRQG